MLGSLSADRDVGFAILVRDVYCGNSSIRIRLYSLCPTIPYIVHAIIVCVSKCVLRINYELHKYLHWVNVSSCVVGVVTVLMCVVVQLDGNKIKVAFILVTKKRRQSPSPKSREAESELGARGSIRLPYWLLQCCLGTQVVPVVFVYRDVLPAGTFRVPSLTRILKL